MAKVPPRPVPLRRKDRDDEPLFKRRGLALADARPARSCGPAAMSAVSY